MGRLILVRHGQASFGAADYDQLSELGYEQGRMLGRWWAQRGKGIDRVYCGPMKRHLQTCEMTAEGMGAAWGEVRQVPELAEYSATDLFKVGLPQLLVTRPELADELRRYQAGGPDAAKSFQKVLEALGRAWAGGEVGGEGLESWPEFRQRVARGMERMLAEATRGSTVVAFTSGGSIGAAVGLMLDLDDVKAIELSWQIHNCALTTALFSGQRASLSAFNATPHLSLDAITYR